MGYGRTIGRICFALLFVMSGVNKFTDMESPKQYLKYGGLAPLGIDVPDMVLTVLIIGAALLELIGGALVAFGQERVGAQLLAAFLVTASVLLHAFWNLPTNTAEEKTAHMHQFIGFFKNLSLLGACLYMMDKPKKSSTAEKPKVK